MDALLGAMTKWRIPRPKMTTSRNRPVDPPQDYFDAEANSSDVSPNNSAESSANSSPSRPTPSDDY